jgi:drug/metabolite transporter (DMT)-like permease
LDTRERITSQVVPGLALLTVAAIWGTTFPVVKDALDDIPTFEFLAVRFTIATLVLTAIFPRSARTALRTGWRAGLLAGLFLAFGHAFQTVGLERTLSTNAGFITGLYVVFTPLLAAIALRRVPHAAAVVGVVLTTAGLALMSLQLVDGRPSFNSGDLLVLVCAVMYAGQIVTLARYASEFDPIALAIQQLGVTAVFFLVTMPIEGGLRAPSGSDVWTAILATALGSSVYGISIQTWAQRRISPTRAAVIFSMEAPFAALAAFFLADERLVSRAWFGAALILAGMLIVELRPAKPDEQEG